MFCLFVLEMGFRVTQTDLKPEEMTLNFRFFCLYFPSAGITGMHYHTQLQSSLLRLLHILVLNHYINSHLPPQPPEESLSSHNSKFWGSGQESPRVASNCHQQYGRPSLPLSANRGVVTVPDKPPPLGIVRACTCALAFSSGYISKMKMKPERGILLFNPRWRDLRVGSVCLKSSRQLLHRHEIHSTRCASHPKYCAHAFLDRVVVQFLSESLPSFFLV